MDELYRLRLTIRDIKAGHSISGELLADTINALENYAAILEDIEEMNNDTEGANYEKD